jgi:catechol 2,3-dioxygenase-like lactoylglutathione lyase family enzyme
MNRALTLGFLDHVAIRVRDLEVSSNWYEKVLGLKKYQFDEWGAYPIFMLSNKCGVALFPADLNDERMDFNSKNVKIDHFAFNVDKENFQVAQEKYLELKLDFSFQDHHFFHSLYTKDPDGHTVELTTIVVDESEFYKQ